MLLDLNKIQPRFIKNGKGQITKVLLVIDNGNNSNEVLEFDEVTQAVHYLKELEAELLAAKEARKEIITALMEV